MKTNLYRRGIGIILLLVIFPGFMQAQEKLVSPRPITMAEYEKGKQFNIKDLDNESYVKLENTYILDRYEGRKPYFITGDDGLRKRIDLYRLIARDGMQELGLKIFYTDEKGKLFQSLLPNYTADAKVWEKYFEDIHSIEKIEKNFVLKLSYILSKELSFQQYKVVNGGKDFKDEHATYGTDICFPGEQLVAIKNGKQKFLKDIQPGDELISFDEETKQTTIVKVKELVAHSPKNYALTQLVMVFAIEGFGEHGFEVLLSEKVLQATPNHPMKTEAGYKKMSEIMEGEKIFCMNEKTKTFELFTVLQKTEQTDGIQKVYNIVAAAGTTLLMNGVMVLQK